MKRLLMVMVLGLVLSLPAAAMAFDCSDPPYGASLEELNKDGYFVKYMEKDGIAYYNYTGPCRLSLHERNNPAISWAFVNDQLYAWIIRISSRGVDWTRDQWEAILSEKYGTLEKLKEDGDWTVYSRELGPDKLLKIKYNNKTKETKGAVYYIPLKQQRNIEEPSVLTE